MNKVQTERFFGEISAMMKSVSDDLKEIKEDIVEIHKVERCRDLEMVEMKGYLKELPTISNKLEKLEEHINSLYNKSKDLEYRVKELETFQHNQETIKDGVVAKMSATFWQILLLLLVAGGGYTIAAIGQAVRQDLTTPPAQTQSK